MSLWQLVILLLLWSSRPAAEAQARPGASASAAAKAAKMSNRPRLHQLTKLFVTGDFDGDGRRDTIRQGVLSGVTKAEINRSPVPLHNNWDTVAKWFYSQRADVVLTLNQDRQNRLHLGVGQGLYCLLNIGDNNADGKDEIALVVDYCDDSRVNSCQLFTLCHGKWAKLTQFSIHEEAFDFTTSGIPAFTEISGFLVKKDSQWHYADYAQLLAEDEPGVMKKLVVPPCR